MSIAAPGWYPDENWPGTERFWDGAQWTAHSRPGVVPPVRLPGSTAARVAFVVGLVAAGLALVGAILLAIGGSQLGSIFGLATSATSGGTSSSLGNVAMLGLQVLGAAKAFYGLAIAGFVVLGTGLLAGVVAVVVGHLGLRRLAASAQQLPAAVPAQQQGGAGLVAGYAAVFAGLIGLLVALPLDLPLLQLLGTLLSLANSTLGNLGGLSGFGGI